jgi:predicted Zn-dependent protease with MMP-like domain
VVPPTVSGRLTHRTDAVARRQAEFAAAGEGTVRLVDPRAVSDERFEQLVADALDSIPEELGEQMENVAIVVADWPTADQLDGRAGTLLGLYEGVDLTRRGPIGYAGVMPDRITIFKGPLCARARDEAELAADVRVTVLHEVGHYFGLSDGRLGELGWA